LLRGALLLIKRANWHLFPHCGKLLLRLAKMKSKFKRRCKVSEQPFVAKAE
jgi:hypothetical protein